MALTATVTTNPTQVVENQPFTIQVAVVNSSTTSTVKTASVQLDDSAVGRVGEMRSPSATLTGSSATSYLSWTGVIFDAPGANGGSVTIRFRVQDSAGTTALATGTVTVYPRVQPPLTFGPVLDLRYRENSQNLSLL